MDVEQAFALLRGDGQPWLFVAQAVQIAASPDIVCTVIRCTVYGDQIARSLPPRPAMREWMAMYRRHRSMQNNLASGMGIHAELSASGALDALRAVSRMSRGEIATGTAELTPEEQQEFLRMFAGVPFPPDDATLRRMLHGLDAEGTRSGPNQASSVSALMTSPAGQFFFRVWWPCWILYREYPPRLLRAARLGDLSALDRLLRLDKHALGDPVVARVVADVMSSGPANDRKLISNALGGNPTVKLTGASIRAGLGALISQLAFLFHSKVTAPEIQALFDGIERVRTGSASDPKLTATGEAWSKAVQRGRTWPNLPTKPAGQ